MERAASFVSSRGILKSCDWRSEVPRSSSAELGFNLPDSTLGNASFYVCPEAFPLFFSRVYPKIDSKFTLVTGDSDVAITDALLGHPAFSHLLNNPLLDSWYAQNLFLNSRSMIPNVAKLQSLPIGMDYHTMWENPGFWGHEKQSSIAQELSLLSVIRDAKPFQDRLPVGYCNFHLASPRGDRQECFEQIDHKACFMESVRVPRFFSWIRMARCMFVLSPHGIGLDCHRTWEALLLGCIPVLKRSSFTEIYDGLPVVLLDSWSDFTEAFIRKEAQRLSEKKYDFSSLYLAFWKARIFREGDFSIPVMTLNEFREFNVGSSF